MLFSVISNSKLYALKHALKIYKDFLPSLDLEIFGSYDNKEISKYVEKYKFTKISEKPNRDEYKKISLLINSKTKGIFVFSTRLITNDIFSNFLSINFHPSKLPQYPGLNGFLEAINDKHMGFSAHIIDQSIDQGKLLSTMKIEPFPEYKLKEKYNQISSQICSLMILHILVRISKEKFFEHNRIDFFATSFNELKSKVISQI